MQNMNKKTAYSLCAVLASLTVAPLAHAQLVTYDFESGTSNNGSGPFSFGSSDAAVTATSLSDGAGTTFQGTTRGEGGSSYGIKDNFTNAGIASTSLSDALSSDDYLSFTLTPGAGNTLSFTAGDTITFDLQVFHSANPGGDPTDTTFTAALFTSVDGFASTASQVGDSQSISVVDLAENASSGYEAKSISLSSLGSTGIDTSVEFRLYFVSENPSTGEPNQIFSSRRFLDIDNIVVNGAVAIPEPASFGMLLGGLGLLAIVRRRRR